MDCLHYSPDDPYYRLGPVHTCLYVRVRETGDWDLFQFGSLSKEAPIFFPDFFSQFLRNRTRKFFSLKSDTQSQEMCHIRDRKTMSDLRFCEKNA